jgi:hypothetical protein
VAGPSQFAAPRAYTTLRFDPPTEASTLMLPDVSGTVVTTGNTDALDGGLGLRGPDTIAVTHTLVSGVLGGLARPNMRDSIYARTHAHCRDLPGISVIPLTRPARR